MVHLLLFNLDFLSDILKQKLSSNAVYSLAVLHSKLSHTVTLFFLCTYNEQWPTFLLLFFHVVLEVSGKVADQIIRSARTFLETCCAWDGVREWDAARINEAFLAIVTECAEQMDELHKHLTMDSQT